MHSVLLIDDDGKLGAVLTEYCARFGIAIDLATRPATGLARLDKHRYDAVILDVMLPDMDGFDVLREIRRHSDVPVLMLTARGDLTDRIVGLEIGADDYLPKPFDPRELVARLSTNIKRYAISQHARPDTDSQALCFDGLSIYPDERRVMIGDAAISLTTREYALLTLLATHPGEVFSRDRILSHLRGSEAELFSRSVDILVSRLRAKLRPSEPITTLHGEGYSFTARRLPSPTP